MGIIYCLRNVCTLSVCYTVKNSLKIVHQFQSMNKGNKVELNKVKKRHAIFSYFDPFGFYFLLKYAKNCYIFCENGPDIQKVY